MLKVVIVGFDYGKSKIYKTLHDVLLYSLDKNLPEAIVISNWLEEPDSFYRTAAFVSNTVKLTKWAEEMELASEGDHIAFLDCDMLVVKDFSDIFKENFDVAYTYRSKSLFPINGGVLFVKVNEKSRRFFKLFLEINNKLFLDQKLHKHWQNKYAGMNQAAFGYILEKEKRDFNFLPIPCFIWNLCQEDLEKIDEAKIIHYKGQLRETLFKQASVPPEFEKAVLLWRSYQEEMLQSNFQ